jgi:hypothetical protein
MMSVQTLPSHHHCSRVRVLPELNGWMPKRLVAYHTKSADAGSGAHRECSGSRVDLLNETKGETREYRKCLESMIMSFQDLLVYLF